MQEYVQKSISTTLPFRLAAVSGGELSHCTAPSSGGNWPSTGKVAGADPVAAAIMAFEAAMAGAGAGLGLNLSSSDCSSEVVLLFDTLVSKPVSRPRAMAATPASMARPRPRRIHSPAPSERFMAVNTLPPISRATASEVAAPAA